MPWGWAFAMLLGLAAGAHAATFDVDTTVDDPARTACDEATPDDCSLRGALLAANALAESSTIILPAGIYVLGQSSACTYRLRDFRIPTNSSGPVTSEQIPLCTNGRVTIEGVGAETTVIDGDQRGRVLFVGFDGVVELRGLTIRNGLGDGSFGITPHGGGINNHGTLALTDAVVSDNALDPIGTGASGAGIYNEKGASLTLRRTAVRNNLVPTHTAGAGIYANYGGTVVIADSVVSDNMIGSNGGGILNSGSAMTIIGSTVSGNTAVFGLGGGIANFGVGIQDFDFQGLFPGALTIVNSTISGNTSGSSGGGIYDHGFTTIRLNNVTITSNTGATRSGVGGGITTFTGDGVFVRNTIIAGNVDTRGTSPDCDARNLPGSIPLTSEGHNLIQDPTNCALVGDTTGNITGEDPQLGVLTDNGGPSPTHAPAADSPAVDGGSPAGPGSGGNACAASDQRGFVRPAGAACDIGAVERGGDFAVTSVEPATGGNSGPVSAIVVGSGFVSGATVTLQRSGHPDIAGHPVQVDVGGSAIATTFDLAGAATGPWDVVVMDGEGASKTLAGGFTVEVGRPPDLWVDVSGLLLRPGRPSRFTIVYGNRGNVDALAVPLFLSTSSAYTLSVAFAMTPPPAQPDQIIVDWRQVPVTAQGDPDGGFVNVPLLLPVVPAGAVGKLQIVVTLPPEAQPSMLFLDIDSPFLQPSPDPQVLGELVAGARADAPELFGVTVPPALEPDLEQYVSDQLQLVVDRGREAWIANLGTAAQVYSLTQLQTDAALFAAAEAASEQTSALLRWPPAWGATADRILASLAHRLEPAQARAAEQQCPYIPCKGAHDLVPGCPCNVGPEPVLPPEIPPPPGCNPNEIAQKLGSLEGTKELVLNPPQCRVTEKHCEALPGSTIIHYSDGTSSCHLRKCLSAHPGACVGFPIEPKNSVDPNDKTGPLGVATGRFLVDDTSLVYTVNFENLETANAPAQVVTITDQLDVNTLDLDTLSLGPISFGDVGVIPAPGVQQFTGGVDLRPEQNLVVSIQARLDRDTGLLTWVFTSIDPDTGQLTDDPDAGLLPPNVNPPEGNGSVAFTVRRKGGLGTGTQICNQASIVFDVNAPIVTPQWCNTIDEDLPVSHVSPLPATQASPTFPVEWTGTDAGSGIAGYTILVAEDGGAAVPLLAGTTETSTNFVGRAGSSYAFYSLARDLAGNVEEAPAAPDATTHVCPKEGCAQPTTTSTTLPPCGTVRCLIEDALAGAACGDDTLPEKIRKKLDRAITRVETAPGQPAKKAAKLYKSAGRLLGKAAKAADKAARGKHPKLSDECSTALRGAVSAAVELIGST